MNQTYRVSSRAERLEVQRVAGLIAQLPVDKYDHDDVQEFAPLVVAIFAGVDRDVFQTIDNLGGNARLPEAAGRNFWMVRTVRNNFDWSKKLRAALT